MSLSADTDWSSAAHPEPTSDAESSRASHGIPLTLEQAVDEACALIPPLWTLRNFVAVNAFLGLADRPFPAALEQVDRIHHARGLMPADFYRDRYAEGRIDERDLSSGLAEAPRALGGLRSPLGTDHLLAELLKPQDSTAGSDGRMRTLAEALDRRDGSAWGELVVDEIAKWCAGRFDLGQAAWKQPWRELSTLAAWRRFACLDRSPELRGLRGFRDYVRELPDKPLDAIAWVLEQLRVPMTLRRELLARELASVAGWAGHLQLRAREAAAQGRSDDSLHALLAIRLAFEGALYRLRGCPEAWPEPLDRADSGDTGARHVWQLAYEAGYRRSLLGKLAEGASSAVAGRPALQAVFCIDVRSEVFRRQLEELSPEIQTVGFAGFFGIPVELQRLGESAGSARCPVLISPSHRVREQAPLGSRAARRVLRGQERHRTFTALRKQSIGAFPLVETLGHVFGLRLISDGLGLTRPEEDGALLPTRGQESFAPSLAVENDGERGFGISLSDQVDLAEGALRNMGLTEGFAEVVLLCGHGSRSANNPYASSLDCGACGGHPGGANARVASAILASPQVRAGLAERGIEVPADTHFVAALHDTTTDRVQLLDADALPPGLRGRLEGWLQRAAEAARRERATRFGNPTGSGLERRAERRARDWSEVRPEWGLAGNAAFLAAPRSRTRTLDLEGRVFLHDYDAARDENGEVLRLILTAPLVVASWINLQYYASTVDNGVFGSGNKVLHNVVGRHGVMLGNRGDLRPGLPWQSLHDGSRFVHEPMRLTAIVEAPRTLIERILHEQPEVAELVENDWLRLLAWEPDAGAFYRFLSRSEGWDRERVG